MQHHFILRYLRRPSRHNHHHFRRYIAFNDPIISSIIWVRDRALDHAVEKERNLKPMINLKNLINSEPSKSLPLSIINNQRSSLELPTRPIEFIRNYPSIFQEFLPETTEFQPHIKLTPETLTLDTEEQYLFESEIHKKDVANRLLKLLMIARMNKIPLSVIDRLKWDLGLPNDYTKSVIPQFPEHFQVTGNDLELVCWNDELAVSVMETNSMSSFPLQYSLGFEQDKDFKKFVDDFQKLPYVSPYKNAGNLRSKSQESDKWIVGLMHEVLHLLIPKKTEKDNLLLLGEYLGVRLRFKNGLLRHPGIFYVSSKLKTHTVVLREGYKRDLLVSKDRHELMKLRSSYTHLMTMVVEKNKSNSEEVTGSKKEKVKQDLHVEDGKLSEDEDGEFSEEEDDDSEVECNNDDTKRDNLVGNDNGKNEDHETRGRTSGIVKFKGSHRQNTPNARPADNDRRQRDTSRDMRFARDKRSDSRMRRMPDRGVANRPIFLRTEVPGARGSRATSPERYHAPRTRDGLGPHRRNAPNSRANDNDRRRDTRRDMKYARDERSDSRTRRMFDRDRSRDTRRDMKYARDERSDSRTRRMFDRDRRRDTRGDMKYDIDERSSSRTRRMPDRRVTEETNRPRFSARVSRVSSPERSRASRTREGRF